MLWGSLALDSPAVRAGKAVSLLIILAFAVGSTFFFRAAFSSLLRIEGIGAPLLWRVISIACGTILAMLIISNLITGVATLYRSSEIAFLMSRPVTYRRIFLTRFYDNLLYSSWSMLALGIPLVAAWGMVFGVPIPLVVGAIVLGLLPLVVIASVIGTVILMLLIGIARRWSPWAAMGLILLLTTGVLYWSSTQRSRGLVVEGSARSSTVERYLTQLGRDPRLPVLPSGWLASGLKAVSGRDYNRALLFGGLLSLTAVVWLRWLALAGGRYYYPSWGTFAGSLIIRRSIKAEKDASSQSAARFGRGILPLQAGTLLRKDVLLFLRSPGQWGQLLLLISFFLIYLVNLVYISSRFDFDHPYWKTMVLFLNFAFSGFILATLSVRFVYPLVSMEGRGISVARMAPMPQRVLIAEKFGLAFGVIFVLCQLIVVVSHSILDIGGTLLFLTTLATFLMGLALTALSVGLGALLPDFSEESPMRIASTPGGVMTVVISLLYVAAMAALVGWPTRGYFLHLIGRGGGIALETGLALLAIGLLNLAVIVLPLYFGARSLAKRDF